MSIVNEAHPDFHKLADANTQRAARAAERAREHSPEQLEAMKKSLGIKDEIRAKYKIEVTFGPKRTTQGPNLVGIQLWESGKRLHGGGDEMMFFCRDSTGKTNFGCWGPVKAATGVAAYCPNCKKALVQDQLTDTKVGRMNTQGIAQELVRIFHMLEGSADVYLKYHRTDIRYIAMEKMKGQATARKLKGLQIYPLKNILKDTSNGADLGKRFFAFLTN